MEDVLDADGAADTIVGDGAGEGIGFKGEGADSFNDDDVFDIGDFGALESNFPDDNFGTRVFGNNISGLGLMVGTSEDSVIFILGGNVIFVGISLYFFSDCG